MLPRRIAGRYAEALFDLAQQEGKIEEWAQELAAMSRVIEDTPDFHELLTHPEIPLSTKEDVVGTAFQGQVSREVLAVLYMLIKRGHDPQMEVIHEIFVDRWNRLKQVTPVTVASALPLSSEQLTTLAQTLGNRIGTTVRLQQTIDPELLAGIVITYGDRVIDASARTALEQLRGTMTGG